MGEKQYPFTLPALPVGIHDNQTFVNNFVSCSVVRAQWLVSVEVV